MQRSLASPPLHALAEFAGPAVVRLAIEDIAGDFVDDDPLAESIDLGDGIVAQRAEPRHCCVRHRSRPLPGRCMPRQVVVRARRRCVEAVCGTQ